MSELPPMGPVGSLVERSGDAMASGRVVVYVRVRGGVPGGEQCISKADARTLVVTPPPAASGYGGTPSKPEAPHRFSFDSIGSEDATQARRGARTHARNRARARA